MFDMNQIVEKISGLFEQNGAAGEALTGSMTDLAQHANFDLSALENASVEQLSTLLTEAGIDPNNLTDGQILETAQDLIQSGTLENLDLSQVLGSSKTQ